MSTPQIAIAVRAVPQPQRVLVFELRRARIGLGTVAAQLRCVGYEVSVSDGKGAFDALLDESPVAIVVDARSTANGAFELCRRLRAQTSTADAAILLVTNERSIETFEAALAAGFDDFVTLTSDAESLMESLRATLALHSARAMVSDWEVLKKQRECALRQQLWAERLSALLVHDLKAPLHAIDLLAQGLLRHGSLSKYGQEAALDIRDQTRRMVGMVVDLLDISRSREGAFRATSGWMDARALCVSLLRDFRHVAAGKRVTLQGLSFTSKIFADPELLRRALANLFDNAVQHALPGGTVTLVLSPRKGYTELRVCDDGPGVPPELREAIFEPFKQATPANVNGRGLGLTFCKLAVTAHGGRIWLEDEPRGTVVTITLPDPPALPP